MDSSYSLNGKTGLKMKCLAKNVMLFMALVAVTSPAVAQTPAAPAANVPAAPVLSPVDLSSRLAPAAGTTSAPAVPPASKAADVPTIKEQMIRN